MITYYLNCMGPYSLRWYEDNNVPYKWKWVEFKTLPNIKPRYIKEYTEQWYCGRIDIRGLDESVYWNGWSEYSVPIMDSPSWNKLGEFLSKLKTGELLSFNEIINLFELENGEIRWWEN